MLFELNCNGVISVFIRVMRMVYPCLALSHLALAPDMI